MAGNGLIGSLRVTLGANTAEFDRAMDRSRRTVADTTKRFSGLERSAAASAGAMKAAFAGIAIGIGAGAARSFLSLADEAKNLSAQLQLATAKSGSFAQAQEDVARIASATREGLTATAALYGNFMRATEQMGKSQGDAARATETFGKALKIGGADANAAASATLQFGQALASGALRGDEFNSIAEASPRIVRLIADAMGVTQGAVRALAAEGKLTSDVLFKALTDRRFTAGIDAEFAKLPVTFDQAMTLVRNAAVTTFGAFDQGGQFSTALADFIGRGADGFASLADAAEAEGRDIRATFAGLSDAFEPFAAGARSAFGQVRREASYLQETIGTLLGAIDTVRNELPDYQRAAQRFDERWFGRRTGFTGDVGPRSDLAGTFNRGYRRSAAQNRADAAARRLQAQGYIVPQNEDGTYNEAGIRRIDRPRPRVSAAPAAAKKTGGRRKGGESARSKADELQTVLDGLLPDDARMRELRAKSEQLGKALAAGLLPLDTYKRATAAIDEQISEIFDKRRTAVSFDTAALPPIALPKVTVDEADQTRAAVSAALANRQGEDPLEILRAGFQSLAHTGNSAMGELGDAIGLQLIPALKQAGDQALSVGDRLAAVANAASSAFGAIFGKKTGSILGGLTTLGLSAAAAISKRPLPAAGADFGGFRAMGGPISPSNWYVVGERGPEVFAPGVAGTVIPNGGRGAGPSQSQVRVVPSPYFDVIVDGRAQAVATPIAANSTSSGLRSAGRSSAWRNRQTVR